CAHPGDDLPAADDIACRHQILLVVGIAGDAMIAVVDVDDLAVTLPEARPDHQAGGDGGDRRAFTTSEIHAVVWRSPSGEGVDAHSKMRGNVGVSHRPTLGSARRVELSPREQILEHRKLA